MKSCCKEAFGNIVAEKPEDKGKFVKWLKYRAAILFGKKKNKLPAHSH
jgi:hypothetical protein